MSRGVRVGWRRARRVCAHLLLKRMGGGMTKKTKYASKGGALKRKRGGRTR